MKRKHERKLGPVHAPAQEQQPEPQRLNTSAVNGVVVIRLSKAVDLIEMDPDQASSFAATVGERAREAFVQRLQLELAATKQRLAELEAKAEQPKEGQAT